MTTGAHDEILDDYLAVSYRDWILYAKNGDAAILKMNDGQDKLFVAKETLDRNRAIRVGVETNYKTFHDWNEKEMLKHGPEALHPEQIVKVKGSFFRCYWHTKSMETQVGKTKVMEIRLCPLEVDLIEEI